MLGDTRTRVDLQEERVDCPKHSTKVTCSAPEKDYTVEFAAQVEFIKRVVDKYLGTGEASAH